MVVCGLLIVVASLAMKHGLQGMQASVVAIHGLQSTGSVAVACGLSCPTVCGISPYQESNPYPLHCKVDSYPLYHQGSPGTRYLFIFINILKIFFTLHPGYVVNYWTGKKKKQMANSLPKMQLSVKPS